MKLVRWMQFTWDLRKLPAAPGSPGASYRIRPATREETTTVLHVALSAMALDSAWNDTLKTFRPTLETRLATLMETREGPALVLTHGSRIIGASVFDPAPDSANHLASGPCISVEYRNRGLGAALLHATLVALRENGVSIARGVTKENVATARFVYPKFGGQPEVLELEPMPAAS